MKVNTKYAKDQFGTMPPWAKGVIGVLIVGGVAYLLYKAFKGGKQVIDTKGAREESRAVAQELDKLNENPATKQKLTKSEALEVANAMHTAMDGWGTDSGKLASAFLRLKNQADWLAVSNAWGVRELSSGKFNPEKNLVGTLPQALASELGTTDASVWVPKMNQYLAKVGIRYRLPIA